MLHIKQARHIKNKILDIEFMEYDGKYTIDMQDYINQRPFRLAKELNDDCKFADFSLDHGVICWKNGFDIAPEYLFFLANKDDPKYQKMFFEWGYLN